MTEISDRYRRRAGAMTERIAGVADDAWGVTTPCEGWTATDVVQHLVDTTGMFLGFVGQDPPVGPAVADDPAGASPLPARRCRRSSPTRATGQDERMDPYDVERVHAAMATMDDKLRTPGAFGSEVEPPPDADAQTRLLCFLGRSV